MPVLLFFLIVYLSAIAAALKNRPGLCGWLLVLGGLGLRLFCALDPLPHDWDERFHALVAKNLMADPLRPLLYREPLLPFAAGDWGGGHVWLHKQPLPLWCMAASMKLLGAGVVAMRLPSLLLSAFSVWLTWRMGRRWFDERIGLWAAFFQSVNGLVIEIGSGRVATDHVDLFFMVMVQVSIWFVVGQAERPDWRRLVGCGLFMGLAMLCKWLPGLLALPIFWVCSAVGLRSKIGQSAAMLGIAAAVFLPWQVFAAARFPAEFWVEVRHNARHFSESLDGQGGPFWFFLDRARVNWGELVYLPFGWLAVQFFLNKEDRRLRLLAVWIGLPCIFFSAAQTKMQGYVLFAAPAVFLLAGLFLEKFEWKKLPRLPMVLRVAFTALAVRYCLERVKPLADRSAEWAVRHKIELLARSHPPTEKLVVVNCPAAKQVMFFTPFTAYEWASPEQRQQLAAAGWLVVDWKDFAGN